MHENVMHACCKEHTLLRALRCPCPVDSSARAKEPGTRTTLTPPLCGEKTYVPSGKNVCSSVHAHHPTVCTPSYIHTCICTPPSTSLTYKIYFLKLHKEGKTLSSDINMFWDSFRFIGGRNHFTRKLKVRPQKTLTGPRKTGEPTHPKSQAIISLSLSQKARRGGGGV